jgi:F0F1-type ATP synthase membrane subunit b/b'
VAAVSPSLTTFIFETANFVALAALLAWLFFKPVRSAIETQRLNIRTQEEEAARKLSEAEQIRQEIDSQRRQLNTELERMRAESRTTAKQESDALLAATRAQLERERTVLQRDMLNLEKSQITRLAGVLASAAHATIKRFFEQLEGPELEQLLLKSACRELTLLAAHALGPVTIECATSLDTEAQQTIALAMGAHQTTMDVRVVPELVAGVRIATQQGLIDASVTGLARFAEQVLIDDMTAMIQEESDHA